MKVDFSTTLQDLYRINTVYFQLSPMEVAVAVVYKLEDVLSLQK